MASGVIPSECEGPTVLAGRPATLPGERFPRRVTPRNDIRLRWTCAVIVLTVALLAIDALPVGVVHDDGMYTVLAKALATGRGYRWINLPGAPLAVHYPPGYPALLSVVWRLVPDVGRAVTAFKVFNALLLSVVAYTIHHFATSRLELSPVRASAVTIAGCIGIPMLVLSTLVMSETLFLALLVPALLFAERIVAAEDERLGGAMKLGILAALLVLVRTHGVAFLAAVVVALLVKRRWRSGLVAGLSGGALLAPWQLFQALHQRDVPAVLRGDYGTYTSWLASGFAKSDVTLGRIIGGTSRELFSMFAAVTTPAIPTVPLRWIAVLAALAMLALGLLSLWTSARVTALFLAAYVAIIVAWPFTPARFLWGIWPLVVLTFIAGGRRIHDWRPSLPWQRGARVAIAASVGLALIGHATYTVRGYRHRYWASIPESTTQVVLPALAWIDGHTAPTAVVSTNAELLVYLYTGRLAVPATTFAVSDYFGLPSVASRTEALRSILQAYRIDAVAIVANDSLEQAARSMATAAAPTLVLRDSVPGGLLFTPIVR